MLNIISTNYKSDHYLKLNYDLTKEANKFFRWIVVCNDHNTNLSSCGEFQCVDGVDMPAEINCNVNKHSHHHALALNTGLKYWLNYPQSQMRFLLFLDPDFYIVPSYDTVITHMVKNGLAFFGAPYAVDGKWRPFANFPTAFCMFVDTWQVAVEEWDFSPKPQADQSKWYDTGHKVYERYADTPKCFECTSYTKNRFTKLKADEYMWGNNLFGIHARMKMHHKDVDYGKLKQVSDVIRKQRDVYAH